MVIHQVRYDWIERFFGTFIAENFNQIYWSLAIIGLIIAIICGRKVMFSWPHKRTKKQSGTLYGYTETGRSSRFEGKDEDWNPASCVLDCDTMELKTSDYINDFEEDDKPAGAYQARHGECSATGWIYDRDTKKWDPPEYLIKESRTRWKWDEEKQIWIDLEKQRRIAKHQAYLASTAGSREPTYEEWKAQKLKEKQSKEDHPVS